ncbi:ABC transporter permease subunit [Alkalibacter mobilis]|uniref:ABC transporter permease subunit n=1 Tax=Alkalibacter mobilis TaxID=2787712 RepID=UPI00189E03F1|nr:ABC transporter permease subunit [Alkalibacter mobilis]MBF7097183.1 ABC transporter permease [Alkalibacter mobilis]
MFEMIGVIVKKELRRLFTDRRLIFTTLILPPVMLVVLYGIIGLGASSMISDVEEHKSVIYTVNAPDEILDMLKGSETLLNEIEFDEIESVKEQIKNGTADVLLEFDPKFHDKVTNYKSMEMPFLNTYHNPSEDYSSSAYYIVSSLLNQYENILLGERMGSMAYANVFEIDGSNPDPTVVDDKKASGKFLSMLLPMMITIFLFAGAMSLGPDSIAGEKERGTMSTLLMTPVSREVIAFGKVISLGILAFLSALSSFIGIIVALPLLAGSLGGEMGIDIGNYVNYSILDYIMILLILLSMEGIFVGLISVASVIAKNVKEAGTYLMPIYFVVMIAAFSNMYSTQTPEMLEYAIPVYGSILALKSVLNFEMPAIGLLANIVVSVLVTVGLVSLIKVLFEKENVMFNQ